MIDFIFEQICENHLIENDQDKIDFLENLQSEMTALRKSYLKYPITDLDYSSSAIQEAYLLGYFPHYTLPIEKILSEHFKNIVFSKEKIDITLIGGGPCPEIIAIIKYLKSKNNLPNQININLLDKYASNWEYSHKIIKPYINHISNTTEVIINQIDFELCLNFDDRLLVNQLEETDILTIQNILNELPENQHNAIKKLLNLIKSSKQNILTVISELYGSKKPPEINSIFQEFIKNNDYEIHENFNAPESNSISKTYRPKLVYKHLLNGSEKDMLIPRKHCKYRYFTFKNDLRNLSKNIQQVDLPNEIDLADIINSFSYINDADLKNQTFIGIDFGTSTSYAVVGSFNDNQKFSFNDINFEQKGYLGGKINDNKLKTCIALHENMIYVGEGAHNFSRNSSARENENYWINFKLNLTNEEDEFEKSKCKTISDSQSASKLFLKYISGFIDMKIQSLSGVSSHNYMLSIPSSYNFNQRQKYIKLINYIGIDTGLKEMIDEPNAALLSYLNDNKISFNNEINNVLVFDYGAGTCDISIVKIYNSKTGIKMSNLAVSEFAKIGGNHLDTQITRKFLIKQIVDQLESTQDVSSFIEEITPALESKAEVMKIALCKKSEINIEDNSSKQDLIRFKNKIYNLTLNTDDLKEVSAYCFNKNERFYAEQNSIYSSINKTTKKAGIHFDKINLVIFIGGGAKNPFIRGAVKDLFKNAKFDFPQSYVIQNQSRIAQGSAIYGYLLKKTLSPIIHPISLDIIDIVFKNNKAVNVFNPGNQLPTDAKSFKINFSKKEIISNKIEVPIILNKKEVLIAEFTFNNNWDKYVKDQKLDFIFSIHINENNQIMTSLQSMSDDDFILLGNIKETRSNQLIFKNYITECINNKVLNIQDVIDLSYMRSEIMDYNKGIELINLVIDKNLVDKNSIEYKILMLRLADIYIEMFNLDKASKIISNLKIDNIENNDVSHKLNYLIAKIAYEKNDIDKLRDIFTKNKSNNIQLNFLWGMYLKNSIGRESEYKKYYKITLDLILLRKENNNLKHIQLAKYIIEELNVFEEKYVDFYTSLLLNKFAYKHSNINSKD